MVRIRHHIPDTKKRKPDPGVVSIIYNLTNHKNKRHGIIAGAREVWNVPHHIGDGSRLILWQRLRGSV
jgi:hypothetical protein